MKLWTDGDLKDVEILVEKLEKNLKSEPGPIKQLMIMIGQAFAEIKHYKSIIEQKDKALKRLQSKAYIEGNAMLNEINAEIEAFRGK